MNTTASSLRHDASALVDSAARAAERALHSTQDSANHALDQMADQASGLMARGSAAVHHRSDQVRAQVQQGRDSTLSYIQHEPFKAVLMAAAAGAALMLLTSLLSRRSSR